MKSAHMKLVVKKNGAHMCEHHLRKIRPVYRNGELVKRKPCRNRARCLLGDGTRVCGSHDPRKQDVRFIRYGLRHATLTELLDAVEERGVIALGDQ